MRDQIGLLKSLGALIGLGIAQGPQKAMSNPLMLGHFPELRMQHRYGNAPKKQKRTGYYIPGGPNRNCGWDGICPTKEQKAARLSRHL